jgi:DNA repair protein RadC
MKSEKPHSAQGHRQRLRERFALSGFNGFHDYEVLELLLTFIFRQGDVKPLAKELIRQFGSFSRVLDAPVETLASVHGMGETSSQALKALREALAYYFADAVASHRVQLTKMSQLIDFLRSQIGHRHNEVLYAVFLNAKNEVLAFQAMSEGTVTQAAAYPRRIIEEALRQKATSLILAHNHPDGAAEPSDGDVTITKEIQKALGLVEVILQDHIILTDNEYFSFKRDNLI